MSYGHGGLVFCSNVFARLLNGSVSCTFSQVELTKKHESWFQKLVGATHETLSNFGNIF